MAAAEHRPASAENGVWNVRGEGARGDKHSDDTAAIQRSIDRCHAAGGGTVLLPPGDYLSGTLRLKDSIDLHLASGATLWGSTERAAYPVPHLIHADGACAVSITGRGRIDGQGEAFWVRTGDHWRAGEFRPRLVQFKGCRNVLVEGITIVNAPEWTVHLFRCDTVYVRGLTILNDPLGPNTDGIDPNCSTNVHISDCHIVAGDDCIVLKATERHPCENVTVTNCTLETTCAALKLGTESHGNIRHCTFSNCTIRNTRTGIALYMKDGGTMESVLFANISMELSASLRGGLEWPLFIDVERRGEDSRTGTIRDVTLSHVVIQGKGRCVVQGMRSSPVERLTLDHVTLKVRGYEDLTDTRKPRGSANTRWMDPEAGSHWAAPAHFVFANVRDLRLRSVDVVTETDEPPEAWSDLFCDNVDGLVVDDCAARRADAGETPPVIALSNCRRVRVRTWQSPQPGTPSTE